MDTTVVGSLQRLDPRLVAVWAVPIVLVEVLIGAALVALAVALGVVILAVVFAVLVLAVAVGSVLVVRRAWARWGYILGVDAVELHHGLVVERRSVVPYHRIQQVDLERGPVDRWLGLTTVVLRTAAATTAGRIPAVTAEVAEEIRSQLLTRSGHDDAV